MAVKITWLGHACLLIETPLSRLLIDPFLTRNSQAAADPETIEADYILLSHGHGDHLGDAPAIARRTGAMIISNSDLIDWLQRKGLTKTHPLQIGGMHAFPWGQLKLTIAHHGSALPDGSYGGPPAGFLFTIEGKKIYFAGDTGLFYDMKLIGEEGLALAILPIGDNYTMGPDDAMRAVKLLNPARVLPIHYNTFELIRQDPAAWAARVERETRILVDLLKPGGSIILR
jgi:L-ascorbate metabolism protein UlaG (beta-lactamase superfamily)